MVGLMLSMTRDQWGVDISPDICCRQALSELQDMEFKEAVSISGTYKKWQPSDLTMYSGSACTNSDVVCNVAIGSWNLEPT
jgi:hypothetical protein